MLWTADSFDPKGAGARWVYLYCKKKMRSEGSHSHPAAKGVGSVSLFLFFYSGEVRARRGCPRGFRGFGSTAINFRISAFTSDGIQQQVLHPLLCEFLSAIVTLSVRAGADVQPSDGCDSQFKSPWCLQAQNCASRHQQQQQRSEFSPPAVFPVETARHLQLRCRARH